MKRIGSFSLIFTVVVIAAVAGCSVSHEAEIVISNTADFERADEPVKVPRSDLEAVLGAITEGKVPMLVNEAGEVVPSQTDDLNGDGNWDELFFISDLGPVSDATIRLSLVNPGELPVFPTRTNIRMAEMTEEREFREIDRARRLTPDEGQAAGTYQLEGPSWENELVGFRNYLDARNGMDIFGKLIPEMVLDRAGTGEDYHSLQNWGMDILRVGTSLGAGALALEKNGSLHRVAPEASGWFEKVTEGPLRSVFRLHFDNWTVEGKTISLVHEISIHAGAWYYESKVTLPGFEGDAKLVTGITTIDLGDGVARVEHFEDKWTAVMTHGNQAYDYEKLGMAIMLDKRIFSGSERVGPEGENITNTYLVRMSAASGLPFEFRFYSCWEMSDPGFADTEYFYELLKRDALRLAHPVGVAIK